MSAVSSKYKHADHQRRWCDAAVVATTHRDPRLRQTHVSRRQLPLVLETCLRISLLSIRLETPAKVLSVHLLSRLLAITPSDWPKAEGESLRATLFSNGLGSQASEKGAQQMDFKREESMVGQYFDGEVCGNWNTNGNTLCKIHKC